MEKKSSFTPLGVFARPLLLLMLGMGGAAQAQAPAKSDSENVERIRTIMANRNFETRAYVKHPNKDFCEAFLQDFRQQKGIEHIEPVSKAESYDDPVWQPYKTRCPDLELFESYGCLAEDAEYIATLPKGEGVRYRRNVCEHFRGTANFKLYEVDINNDPAGGKEKVFHYERAQGPLNRPDRKVVLGNGKYQIVDLGRCEVVGGSETHDPYSYFYQRPLKNYNGIIKYKGKHYIFDLYDLDGSDRDENKHNYTLRLNGYAVDARGSKPRLVPNCSFNTLFLSRKK